jgi:hypothetical protein
MTDGNAYVRNAWRCDPHECAPPRPPMRDPSRCMRLHFTAPDFNNINLRTGIRREQDFMGPERDH